MSDVPLDGNLSKVKLIKRQWVEGVDVDRPQQGVKGCMQVVLLLLCCLLIHWKTEGGCRLNFCWILVHMYVLIILGRHSEGGGTKAVTFRMIVGALMPCPIMVTCSVQSGFSLSAFFTLLQGRRLCSNSSVMKTREVIASYTGLRVFLSTGYEVHSYTSIKNT